MKMRLATLLTLLGMLTVTPALALDLHGARSTGLVGEKSDGYIAALKPTPEVQSLVTDVNTKRQQEYTRISQEKGQPVDVVAKLAAQQIITQLTPGSAYQATDGSWKKR